MLNERRKGKSSTVMIVVVGRKRCALARAAALRFAVEGRVLFEDCRCLRSRACFMQEELQVWIWGCARAESR